MDRREWWARVHRVTKSCAWLKRLSMLACIIFNPICAKIQSIPCHQYKNINEISCIFSKFMKSNCILYLVKWKWNLLSHVQLFATLWTVAYQAPPFMDSPGKSIGEGSLSLLQMIFPTQGLNSGLPHCKCILYQLSHQGSPPFIFRVHLNSEVKFLIKWNAFLPK